MLGMIIIAAAAMQTDPVFADLNPKVPEFDVHQIKRIAVVSVLGDTLHARQVGLVVFQTKVFDAKTADWGLDVAIRTQLEAIVASGKISADVAPLGCRTDLLDCSLRDGPDPDRRVPASWQLY